MYQEHPAFETPPKSAIVWRYMSFAKYVSLIAKDEFISLGIEKPNAPFLKNLHTQGNPKGVPVRIDVTRLIDEIILPPKCAAYLKECVEYVTKPKIPKPKITCSEISAIPNGL